MQPEVGGVALTTAARGWLGRQQGRVAIRCRKCTALDTFIGNKALREVRCRSRGSDGTPGWCIAKGQAFVLTSKGCEVSVALGTGAFLMLDSTRTVRVDACQRLLAGLEEPARRNARNKRKKDPVRKAAAGY